MKRKDFIRLMGLSAAGALINPFGGKANTLPEYTISGVVQRIRGNRKVLNCNF